MLYLFVLFSLLGVGHNNCSRSAHKASSSNNTHYNTSEEDRITYLPGLTIQPTFAQYSGYLKGSSDNYYLHYWLVEAHSNPQNAPLVLWLNGGPGCSSMEGLLSENGPFTVKDKLLLEHNLFSWNYFANVLYLESPPGVGYSFARDGNITSDDDLTSLNNYHALISFLEKFPAYVGRDFYIFGESYGGVYVPTLTIRILRNRPPGLNLKSIAIGNGLVGDRLNDNSLIYFMNFHGLIDEDTWNAALKSCCADQCSAKCMFTDNQNSSCQQTVEQITLLLNGLDVYNLYAPCDGGVTSMAEAYWQRFPLMRGPHHSFRPDLALLFGGKLFREWATSAGGSSSRRLVLPCVDDSKIRNYMNNPEVRQALHVDLDIIPEWDVCSADVANAYKRIYHDMSKHYLEILDSSVPVLLFAGDVDMACNFLGIVWFADSLGLKPDKPMAKWFYKDIDGTKQVGGMYKRFVSNTTPLVYATVRGSGHMVPQDKPVVSYQMIDRFMKNNDLSKGDIE